MVAGTYADCCGRNVCFYFCFPQITPLNYLSTHVVSGVVHQQANVPPSLSGNCYFQNVWHKSDRRRRSEKEGKLFDANFPCDESRYETHKHQSVAKTDFQLNVVCNRRHQVCCLCCRIRIDVCLSASRST